jgi:hypothetical protein
MSDHEELPGAPVIDPKLCMAKRDNTPLFCADRCQEPATHTSVMGRRCARHAEELRNALRNPDILGNVLAGRARTEEEISALVRELSS